MENDEHFIISLKFLSKFGLKEFKKSSRTIIMIRSKGDGKFDE